MEGTTVFVNSVTYIVNITHVQIEAYGANDADLRLARMVGLMDPTKATPIAIPTNFNLLSKSSTTIFYN